MDATPAATAPRPHKWLLRRSISLAIVLFFCLMGVTFVREQRQLTRNSQCRGKLAKIGLALQINQSETGSLPPLITSDDRGNPLMSWRVRLLPYFNERQVYSELDLSEPWNSPKNVAVDGPALSRVVRWFRSPNDFAASSNETSFVAIDIPENTNHGRRLVIAVVHNTGIHWMEPRDLSRPEIKSRIEEMLNRGVAVHILTADGEVGTIADSLLTFFGSVDDLFDRWLSPD
jgi:hypothetical protein